MQRINLSTIQERPNRIAPIDQKPAMNLLRERERSMLERRKSKLDEEIASKRYGKKKTINGSNFHSVLLTQAASYEPEEESSIEGNEHDDTVTMARELLMELNANSIPLREEVQHPPPKQEDKSEEHEESSEEGATISQLVPSEWHEPMKPGLGFLLLFYLLKEFITLKGFDHPLLINMGEINAIITYLIAKYLKTK